MKKAEIMKQWRAGEFREAHAIAALMVAGMTAVAARELLDQRRPMIIEGDAEITDFAMLAKLPKATLKRLLAADRLWLLDVGRALADKYEATFGNSGAIGLPELLYEERLLALLVTAIRRGRPLSQAEVAQTLPAAAKQY